MQLNLMATQLRLSTNTIHFLVSTSVVFDLPCYICNHNHKDVNDNLWASKVDKFSYKNLTLSTNKAYFVKHCRL